MTAVNDELVITALKLPEVNPDELRVALNEAGYESVTVDIILVVGGGRRCPAGGTRASRSRSSSSRHPPRAGGVRPAGRDVSRGG